MTKNKAIGDVLFSILLIVLAIIVIRDVSKLSPSVFDPLGPSFFPKLISTIIIALSAFILLKAFWTILKGKCHGETTISKEKIWHCLILSIAIVAYVATIAYRFAPFSVLTALFLIISINVLANFQRDIVLRSIIVGVVLGAACEVAFTHILVMDLPHF